MSSDLYGSNLVVVDTYSGIYHFKHSLYQKF